MSNRQNSEVSLSRRLGAARRYLDTRAGQALLSAERACLGPVLETLSGRHGLELAPSGALLDLSAVGHVMQWAPCHETAIEASTLVCDPAALPLADESLELVLIHHLLEIVPEPHHLLREAARVTDHHGRLLIVGWHPFGSAGPLHWLARQRGQWPMAGHWRSVSRLRDWLTFVDFEIERVDYCGFALPAGMPHNEGFETLGRRWNLPIGQTFVIRARRRVQRINPIRPRFASRFLLPGATVPGGLSAARKSCNDDWHRLRRSDKSSGHSPASTRQEHS